MKKKARIKTGALAISLGVTLAALFLGFFLSGAVTPEACMTGLGKPLARLMAFIALGLFAGQLIELLGWTRQVSVIARPLFRFSGLGHHCGAAFTTAFISGAAANAMLWDYYQDEKIDRLKLFLSNYINQFPAYFLHLPTTVFIVVPLTGKAGLLYFLLTFLAVLFRTFCFLIFGRIFIAGRSPKGFDFDEPVTTAEKNSQPKSLSMIWSAISRKLPVRIINISTWVLPIYTLVFVLNTNGFFDYLNTSLSRFVTLSFMPVESLSVVILSFAAEFTSGFAAAGALMNAGVLSVKQTVIALLFGNVLAFPIRALRHQIPRYMGIFTPKMGLELLLSGQAFRIISLIIVGMIYFLVAP